MLKFLALVTFLLLAISFNHSQEDGAQTSPSPSGDTRMGADAATTGTDVTDKEMQAQEDKGKLNQEQKPPRKKEAQEEEDEPLIIPD